MTRLISTISLILILTGFQSGIKADEFETETLKLIQKTGQHIVAANYVTSLALAYKEQARAAIQEATQGAMGDTEIEKIVDRWIPEYADFFAVKYREALIQNYRDNFSLGELRDLNKLYEQPALQKLATKGFIVTNFKPEQLVSELADETFELIQGLLRENKTYQEIEEQEKLSHQVDPEFNQMWDKAVDWASYLPEEGWGMFDWMSYHYVADRAESCGFEAEFKSISDIVEPMSKTVFEWRDNKLATLNGIAALKETDSEIGDVSTTEQAMYSAAFLAHSDAYWHYFLGLELGRIHEGGEGCSAVKYLFDSLANKRSQINKPAD